MKNLIIIGARGWGREVYDIAKTCINEGAQFTLKGFLDDKYNALDNTSNYPPILSSVEDYNVQSDDVFVCALGDVYYKKKYIQIITDKGGEFISLIHPTVLIGTNTKIGIGCIIGPYASISCDTQLGNYVTFSVKAAMGHDSTIGDYSHIGGFTNISGFVQIGESVTIHPCCNIIPHRKIGDNSTVGTGSVVLNNVKEGVTVFGNPAKKLEF
jgi:sugar O-acyltransferase (sialic acid O-acetyltransferase NeuD family)